jgi:hypothetical protein
MIMSIHEEPDLSLWKLHKILLTWSHCCLFIYMVLGSYPRSYTEAKGNPHWEEPMKEEYNSLIENNTWELVPLHSNRKLVRCK